MKAMTTMAGAAALALMLAGCGGGAEEASEPATDASETAAPAASETPPAEIEGITNKRLSFAPGASSARVEGSITGYETIDYLLGVRAGQPMNISMASKNTAAYFNLLEPGETEVAVFNGSMSENMYEGVAAKSGDYRIRVYMMRSAARRDEVAPYVLEVAVGGAKPAKAAVGAAAASGDPIRGKGGLEQKCLAKVAEITRAPVIGTNRIEESQAATEIYVNVDGAQAPWKCLGYKDGTLGEVMYTGDEGAL